MPIWISQCIHLPTPLPSKFNTTAPKPSTPGSGLWFSQNFWHPFLIYKPLPLPICFIKPSILDILRLTFLLLSTLSLLFLHFSCKMRSASKAWMVAASIGAVEALKDQGFCRWNNAIRSIQQHAKNHFRSISLANNLSSSSSSSKGSSKLQEDRAKQSEESLRKVMYLSCWGPN